MLLGSYDFQRFIEMMSADRNPKNVKNNQRHKNEINLSFPHNYEKTMSFVD
jgi:hypothetical protein